MEGPLVVAAPRDEGVDAVRFDEHAWKGGDGGAAGENTEGGTTHMTATQFATELKVSGLRMVGNQIVSDDCPGIVWKPVTKRGQIDRASTLREVIRGRRAVIVRQVRIGMA
jgi:hypothetical protein